MNQPVTAAQIADFLQAELIGPDLPIEQVVSLDNLRANVLGFISNPLYNKEPDVGALLLIHPKKKINGKQNSHIICEQPQLAFAQVVQAFFYQKPDSGIHPSAIVHPNAKIAESASIGAHAVIEDNVSIGTNTIIQHNVVIHKNTFIGNDCIINANTVIGADGFGSLRDKQGVPHMMRHVGKVMIGDRVEVGASCTIQKGTLDATVIGDDSKFSQQVSIGHNAQIGAKVEIAGMAHLSGSCVIGDSVFIGANSSVRDKVVIGEGARIGIGVVVDHRIKPNQIVRAARAEVLPITT